MIDETEIERMAADARRLRNAKLAETDWMVLPDRNPSEALLAWRQLLRDVTKHEGFPLEMPNIPINPPES
jgi:hypothetical protein